MLRKFLFFYNDPREQKKIMKTNTTEHTLTASYISILVDKMRFGFHMVDQCAIGA